MVFSEKEALAGREGFRAGFTVARQNPHKAWPELKERGDSLFPRPTVSFLMSHRDGSTTAVTYVGPNIERPYRLQDSETLRGGREPIKTDNPHLSADSISAARAMIQWIDGGHR